ncbi:uncharacterized protein H6S33_007026 [Morchella sextelata]|uniref:uncharacterized protein n=1 Tax=Morchella sextelata TaxID=1174677 RepID=UPI001D04D89F|nr:uncharacterized protein H6S33_007026 [Morchella sextelata]KAH0603995.1 hypothetical protein H6S33_007026 [Morchella sextelata]
MLEANESPATSTEDPPPGPSEADFKSALDSLTFLEEKVLSMCTSSPWLEGFFSRIYLEDPSAVASRNIDCGDYRMLSTYVRRVVKEEHDVREMMRQKELSLIGKLENMERDVQSLKEENATLREEIEKDRELIQRARREMELKEREMETEGVQLRAAQEQEIQRFKRENEKLREEIEKERQLIREDVRREMELKTREIGIQERTLREAQELGERAKMDAERLVARD